MPKRLRNHLMLAVRDMPMEACTVLLSVAAAHDWPVRRDDRTPPRVRSGEVVVAMAPAWLAMAAAAGAPRPRGLILLTSAPGPASDAPWPHPDIDYVVQEWPCEASRLADHLSRLMAPAPLSLDSVSRTVSHRGRLVHLTPKECRILQVLMAHAGEAVAREVLEATLHAWGQEFESNTLEVHVHRLRRKLPEAGIRAVRGHGYVLIAQCGRGLPAS